MADIMNAIDELTNELPSLRDSLKLTQRELAEIIGISRRSVIDLEHKKITRSVLISIITFFLLRLPSATIL